MKRFSFLISVLCLLFSLTGCIRLKGGAGYYTEKDGEVKSKQVGFDTDDLNPNKSQGNIAVPDGY